MRDTGLHLNLESPDPYQNTEIGRYGYIPGTHTDIDTVRKMGMFSYLCAWLFESKTYIALSIHSREMDT
jgi:hypothetical protein